YIDPNSHLDIMVTDGENNNTGWSNPEYDRLITAARSETDEKKRFELFHQAERILMDELPIIPIYYYVDKNMLKKKVHGFHRNPLDQPPLSAIWIDDAAPSKGGSGRATASPQDDAIHEDTGGSAQPRPQPPQSQ